MILFEKTGIEITEGVKHIATYMHIVVDAFGLQFVHACRRSGHHKFSTACQIIKRLWGILCVFVIRRTEDYTFAPAASAASTPSWTVLNPRLSIISYPAHPKKLLEN